MQAACLVKRHLKIRFFRPQDIRNQCHVISYHIAHMVVIALILRLDIAGVDAGKQHLCSLRRLDGPDNALSEAVIHVFLVNLFPPAEAETAVFAEIGNLILYRRE